MLILPVIIISGISIFFLIRPPKNLMIDKQISRQDPTIYDNSVAELTP